MKNEILRKWALGAEVVSAVAVVVTVGFLAFQIMKNTSATQAQTYQLLMQEMNEYRRLFTEPGMAEISSKRSAQGWDALELVEKRQWYASQTIRWGMYESAYFANKRGVLGEPEWRRFERAFCRGHQVSAHLWNTDEFTPVTELLTPEFVDFVEATCK